MEMLGNCRLCGERKMLIESHIWPAFGYKDFVADLSKGGLFADLTSEQKRPSQRKENWFCRVCEEERMSPFESYARCLCKFIIENGTSQDYQYDERLLRFFTIMSFRIFLYYHREKPIDGRFLPTLKIWRQYLLEKRHDVASYTQHALIVLGRDGAGIMSGEVDADEGFVFSRFGPFYNFGLLGCRKHLTPPQIKVFDRHNIHAAGGTLIPTTSFVVGDTAECNVTPALMAYLRDERRRMERTAIRKATKKATKSK